MNTQCCSHNKLFQFIDLFRIEVSLNFVGCHVFRCVIFCVATHQRMDKPTVCAICALTFCGDPVNRRSCLSIYASHRFYMRFKIPTFPRLISVIIWNVTNLNFISKMRWVFFYYVIAERETLRLNTFIHTRTAWRIRVVDSVHTIKPNSINMMGSRIAGLTLLCFWYSGYKNENNI